MPSTCEVMLAGCRQPDTDVDLLPVGRSWAPACHVSIHADIRYLAAAYARFRPALPSNTAAARSGCLSSCGCACWLADCALPNRVRSDRSANCSVLDGIGVRSGWQVTDVVVRCPGQSECGHAGCPSHMTDSIHCFMHPGSEDEVAEDELP